MWKEFREETATEGSFCRCRNGSPPGHCVPETMLTFGPTVCPVARDGPINAIARAAMRGPRLRTRKPIDALLAGRRVADQTRVRHKFRRQIADDQLSSPLKVARDIEGHSSGRDPPL